MDPTDARTIQEFADLLDGEVKGADPTASAEFRQETQRRQSICVLSSDPEGTRRLLQRKVLPSLGIGFDSPRITKDNGVQVVLTPSWTDGETFLVRFRKGGSHRRGRRSEMGLVQLIQSEIDSSGVCRLRLSDGFGKRLSLDAVQVLDTSAVHGKACRADVTLQLEDGTRYGLSLKKTNANIVAKVRRVLADILFQTEKRLREHARANGLATGDYLSVRVSNPEFLDLCWFGTDIAQGAVVVGDFESVSSPDLKVERIIEHGDQEALDRTPVAVKWRVASSRYTMELFGVVLERSARTSLVEGLDLPGINSPIQAGRKFRRDESGPVDEARIQSGSPVEGPEGGLWDKVRAAAATGHLVWLKYRTEDEGHVLSRKVAPVSFRRRNGSRTYLFAQDETPGENGQLKSFLTDNCLDAKATTQRFSPKWDVEIQATGEMLGVGDSGSKEGEDEEDEVDSPES